jgi:hypothetical protein
MTKDTDCVDGFCPMKKPAVAKDPRDVFFEPIDEGVKPSEPSLREKFIKFCDDNPNDVECRLFDV